MIENTAENKDLLIPVKKQMKELSLEKINSLLLKQGILYFICFLIISSSLSEVGDTWPLFVSFVLILGIYIPRLVSVKKGNILSIVDKKGESHPLYIKDGFLILPLFTNLSVREHEYKSTYEDHKGEVFLTESGIACVASIHIKFNVKNDYLFITTGFEKGVYDFVMKLIINYSKDLDIVEGTVIFNKSEDALALFEEIHGVQILILDGSVSPVK